MARARLIELPKGGKLPKGRVMVAVGNLAPGKFEDNRRQIGERALIGWSRRARLPGDFTRPVYPAPRVKGLRGVVCKVDASPICGRRQFVQDRI